MLRARSDPDNQPGSTVNGWQMHSADGCSGSDEESHRSRVVGVHDPVPEHDELAPMVQSRPVQTESDA